MCFSKGYSDHRVVIFPHPYLYSNFLSVLIDWVNIPWGLAIFFDLWFEIIPYVHICNPRGNIGLTAVNARYYFEPWPPVVVHLGVCMTVRMIHMIFLDSAMLESFRKKKMIKAGCAQITQSKLSLLILKNFLFVLFLLICFIFILFIFYFFDRVDCEIVIDCNFKYSTDNI